MKKILIILILIFQFCITMPKNTYQPDPAEQKTIKVNSIRVGILKDNRTGENVDKIGLIFLPFVIKSGLELNFPEYSLSPNSTPIKYSLSDALKLELNNRYKLKEVYISEIHDTKSNYSIEGEISKFYCDQKMFTYGLSFFGVILWYTPAPIGRNLCEINVKFKILDKKENIIFDKNYNSEDSIYFSFYYNMIKQNEIQKNILKKLMNEFFKDFDLIKGL